MEMTRRHMFGAAYAVAAMTLTRTALGGWEPSERYPDPAIKSLDPIFNKRQCRAARDRHALVRRAGVVRRCTLPDLERHPQQRADAMG